VPIPWELEVNDRDTLLILEDQDDEDEDEEDDDDEEKEESTLDALADDMWVFASGLFGFSFIMKDMPLAVNMLTSAV
jgi:hypothetical protein